MTSRRHSTAESGFSLLEVLVSLFIVGLTVSIVVVSLPEKADPIDDARTKLTNQVDMVRRVSRTSGEAYGVDYLERGTRVLVYRRGNWEPTTNLGEANSLSFSSGITLEPIDGRGRENERSRISNPEEQAPEPDIWFDPSGLASGESFVLLSQSRRIRLDLERNGAFHAVTQN